MEPLDMRSVSATFQASLPREDLPKDWSSLVVGFLPADQWFFVHTHSSGRKVIHRVALWAQLKDGRVIGMMGIRTTPLSSSLPPPLVPMPALEGCYVHLDQMSLSEKEALASWVNGGQ